jgi:hypothetical protein
MSTGPASPDPKRDDDPARRPGESAEPDDGPENWRELLPSHEDWLTEDEWVASLSQTEPEDWIYPGDDPGDDAEDDPSYFPQPGANGTAGPRAAVSGRVPKGTGRTAKGTVKVPKVPKGGRRGPGQPGSARRVPDASPGPAGSFATGHTLDTAPGGAALHGLAEYAAGPDDRFPGTSDDELTGIICALDRTEAAACALKHAAVAELIRRRPAPDREPALAGPGNWEEFTGSELAWALAETRWAADGILSLSETLHDKVPGTYALFRAGILREDKAAIIARAIAPLTPAEARDAEARILDAAGRQTPGALRAAVRRAVIAVAPKKAKKRRTDAEKNARVERWPEDSGNAGLAGRELPPADVLAADQRITWWAKQLKTAGLDGDMDQLRARAYLDILLNRDSRTSRPGQPADPAAASTAVPPTSGVLPVGFAGHLNLTIPLSVLADRADRPAEIAGIGPIDPDLARDLASAAAPSPRTTWCVTVTDEQGHAIGHGCARPEPTKPPRARTAQPTAPAPPSSHDPAGAPGPSSDHDPPDTHDPPSNPDPPGGTPAPRFTFTATGEPGPPGGYGSWRLATGVPGRPGFLVTLDPIALDVCDHRFRASGHNPGVKLRHLARIRHATCTAPTCRRPSAQTDFEHNIPFENGGATCLCNGGPKCRHDHRLKQHPRWNAEQITPGTFRWTAPSGRQYTTEPTRYPI